MPWPHAPEAEPTRSSLPVSADAEPAVHTHGRSCYWRLEEARWSCDRSATDRERDERR
jgi:hypothetical protein